MDALINPCFSTAVAKRCRTVFAIIVTLLCTSGSLKAEPIQSQNPSTSSAAAEDKKGAAGYYIEFRVATIGTYGHSYAVYGTVGGRENYTDLHPMGGYAVMAIGHILPVPANTNWDPDVLKLPIASRYRKALNAEQYRKVLAMLKTLRGETTYWNAVANNCNHYIGRLAQAAGMKVPGSFQVSYSFVPALKALNESNTNPKDKTSQKSLAASSPRS